MKTRLSTFLLWLLILIVTVPVIYAQNSPPIKSPRRYQALDLINRLREAQGDTYQVSQSDTTAATEQPIGLPTMATPSTKRLNGRRVNKLLSDAALDRFFANQTVRYLTGKTDLSYYNTYFTASSGDGSFNLGRTITQKDTVFEQLLAVTNLGFKTNLLSGLGSLFSDRVWNREVGGFLNHTWLRGGSIWYDKDKGKEYDMDQERAYLLRTIQAEIDQEANTFDAIQQAALTAMGTDADKADFKARQKLAADKFYAGLKKKFDEQYLEREEAAAKKHINYAVKSWITLRGSVSGTSHRIMTSADTEAKNTNFVPVKIGFDYSLYAEDFRKQTAHRFLLTGSAAVFNTNQLRILERYGKKAAEKLGGKTVTKDGDTYWQGAYSTIVQGSIQARGLLTLPQLAPKWSKDVSLDLFADFGVGRYSAHDAGAGLLFTLAGQDSKTPVNVEVLFKLTDFSRRLLPGKDAIDRLQIGLSVTLPIDGMLNKL